MVASQKIGRTAFDLVILLLLFCAPAFRNFVYTQIKPRLTHRGSAPGILRRRFQKRQAESSARRPQRLLFSPEKVTKLLPAQCVDRLGASRCPAVITVTVAGCLLSLMKTSGVIAELLHGRNEAAISSGGRFLPVTRSGSAESQIAGGIAVARDDRFSRANGGSPTRLSN